MTYTANTGGWSVMGIIATRGNIAMAPGPWLSVWSVSSSSLATRSARRLPSTKVRKCFGVLAPGGRVIVVDFLAEPGEAASAFAWLFSTMMYAAQGTRSWSSTEIARLLRDCGASRTAVGSIATSVRFTLDAGTLIALLWIDTTPAMDRGQSVDARVGGRGERDPWCLT